MANLDKVRAVLSWFKTAETDEARLAALLLVTRVATGPTPVSSSARAQLTGSASEPALREVYNAVGLGFVGRLIDTQDGSDESSCSPYRAFGLSVLASLTCLADVVEHDDFLRHTDTLLELVERLASKAPQTYPEQPQHTSRQPHDQPQQRQDPPQEQQQQEQQQQQQQQQEQPPQQQQQEPPQQEPQHQPTPLQLPQQPPEPALQVLLDALQCISVAAATPTGRNRLLRGGAAQVLRDALLELCRRAGTSLVAAEQAVHALACLVHPPPSLTPFSKKVTAQPVRCSTAVATVCVEALATCFAARNDRVKFVAGHHLCWVLEAAHDLGEAHAAALQNASGRWARHVAAGLWPVLSHRLDAANRELCLRMAALTTELCGLGWSFVTKSAAATAAPKTTSSARAAESGPVTAAAAAAADARPATSATAAAHPAAPTATAPVPAQPRGLLETPLFVLLSNLVCVEVRVGLEERDLAFVVQQAPLLSACFVLLEAVVQTLTSKPELVEQGLDPDAVLQLQSALSNAFTGLLSFFVELRDAHDSDRTRHGGAAATLDSLVTLCQKQQQLQQQQHDKEEQQRRLQKSKKTTLATEHNDGGDDVPVSPLTPAQAAHAAQAAQATAAAATAANPTATSARAAAVSDEPVPTPPPPPPPPARLAKAMLVGALRALGAWLAEETEALRESVYAVVPFVLGLCCRSPGDGVFEFLLPGLCHLTADPEGRDAVLSEQALLIEGLRLVLGRADVAQGDPACLGETACNVLLNLAVLHPASLLAHHATLLPTVVATCEKTSPQASLHANLVTLGLFLLLHSATGPGSSGSTRQPPISKGNASFGRDVAQFLGMGLALRDTDTWELWGLAAQALAGVLSAHPSLVSHPDLAKLVVPACVEVLGTDPENSRDTAGSLLVKIALLFPDIHQQLRDAGVPQAARVASLDQLQALLASA
eukprot:m.74234 g.74234  ORF g.74234 m.74234 type:complete len:940 (-) comp14417_c0_seq3:287-3106(-)